VPAYKRAFESHLLDLVRTTVNSTYLSPWIAHLAEVTGEAAEFAGVSGYVAARSGYALSTLPARILGINRGTLRPGAVADITLIDPNLSWTVDVNSFRSKSVNSPFHGWTLQGRAVATIVGGRVKYRLG
jgi:cytosine/adenosine deaminase-related metal-dependent hydrolase